IEVEPIISFAPVRPTSLQRAASLRRARAGMIPRGEPWRDRMQRGAPKETARYGVVVVLAVLAVASPLVAFHLDGLRLAIGVAMVIILAAALITAPIGTRRRAALERANVQLRDEIAERKKVEADLRRKEEFLSEVQRLSRTRE